jgi:hypothetical protein
VILAQHKHDLFGFGEFGKSRKATEVAEYDAYITPMTF